MTKRPFFIAPKDLAVSLLENGNVGISLGPPHESLGFGQDIFFAVELSPHEARALGDLLIRKAREAEGGSSQH
ncbi:hypothetical protein [Pannonibacter sp. SL95]|uniref:hypothetical protein n=1 Tax=Pannonibacter sp. SL95 TaxID=2995153 RepID=UPI002272C449|nr:hypothetical protein [Pannonibacter sp. SL95]MCY1705848.1 hypothetical protein [Pannonibacter sp. SL95]